MAFSVLAGKVYFCTMCHNSLFTLGRWRWMFLFDASITLLLACLGYKYLPDYPHNTEWLDKGEKEVALCRSQQQQQQQQQESFQLTRMEKIKLLVKNKYLYLFMFGWASIHVAMGAAQVLGIVIKKLGFDAITANILTTVRSGM